MKTRTKNFCNLFFEVPTAVDRCTDIATSFFFQPSLPFEDSVPTAQDSGGTTLAGCLVSREQCKAPPANTRKYSDATAVLVLLLVTD